MSHGLLIRIPMVVALTLATATVRAQEAPQQLGDVEVTVAVADGKPLKQATVYAKTGSAALTAAGTAVIAKIPIGKTAVTVDAEVIQGKATKRYMGVAEVTISDVQLQKVKVTVEPVPVIDTYCLGCHPNPRDPKLKIKPGQIVRDIHSSGKAFPEKGYDKYVEMNRKHNAKVEYLDKQGTKHNLMPMPTEIRVVKIGGKDVKRVFYTCETCHSLHQTTPWTRYTRAPFKDKSDLCSGCHS